MTGIFYAMTGWFQFIGIGFLLIVCNWYKEWQKGKWKSCMIGAAFLLLIFIGAVIQYGRETAFRNNYMDQLSDGQMVQAYGKIYKKECKKDSYLYYLKRCSICLQDQIIPCNSFISYFESDEFSIGDTLMLDGKVKRFDIATNEGQFDVQKFYYSQKIDFSLFDCRVQNLHCSNLKVWEWLQDWKEKFVCVIERQLDAEQAGVVAAMLYGEKGLLESEVKEIYRMSGISHILAISGLHVSVIGMALYRFLRKKQMGFGGSAIVAGCWILLYGQMTGFAVSTQRAIGMMLLSMGAKVLGRSNDLLNSLGIMVMILLVHNPFLLQYIGFDFSVLAICGVGITGKIFSEKENVDTPEIHVINAIKERNRGELLNCVKCKAKSWLSSMWMSIGIVVTTLPLVAFSYYEIPSYSFLINMIILPMLGIILILGMSSSVVGLRFGELSFWMLRPISLILHLIQAICKIVEHFPAANRIVGKPSNQKIVLYYIVLGLFLMIIDHINKRRNALDLSVLDVQDKGAIETIKSENENGYHKNRCFFTEWSFSLRVIGCFILVGIIISSNGKQNEIAVLDVGQGDGIYISAKDGTNYFVDGGSSSVKNVGTYRILPFLKCKGVIQIDNWFVSHTDDDHISGLLEVMESGYKIKHLVLSKHIRKDASVEALITKAKECGSSVLFMESGDRIVSPEVNIECLYPNQEICMDRNDMSLVLELTMGNFRGILAGDISSEAEQKLVEKGLLKDVDFYKVNHHGSKYSSCEEFLERIRPEISIISCAKKNRYGHPSKEAVSRIRKSGCEIYFTMNSGQISITETGIREYGKLGFAK